MEKENKRPALSQSPLGQNAQNQTKISQLNFRESSIQSSVNFILGGKSSGIKTMNDTAIFTNPNSMTGSASPAFDYKPDLFQKKPDALDSFMQPSKQ